MELLVCDICKKKKFTLTSSYFVFCRSHCCFSDLGFIKFLGPYYMLLITKRRKIGTICGHAVYAISKSEMIPIPNPTVRSTMGFSKNENRSLVNSACKCKMPLVLLRISKQKEFRNTHPFCIDDSFILMRLFDFHLDSIIFGPKVWVWKLSFDKSRFSTVLVIFMPLLYMQPAVLYHHMIVHDKVIMCPSDCFHSSFIPTLGIHLFSMFTHGILDVTICILSSECCP